MKEHLGLSAAFLASLGFWAGLPWALKMPLGHLVDLYWRQKSFFVFLGAAFMATSLLIMVGLTGYIYRIAGDYRIFDGTNPKGIKPGQKTRDRVHGVDYIYISGDADERCRGQLVAN